MDDVDGMDRVDPPVHLVHSVHIVHDSPGQSGDSATQQQNTNRPRTYPIFWGHWSLVVHPPWLGAIQGLHHS